MGVSKNNGTPKSSILVGFSIIFTIHFGGNTTPIFGSTSIYLHDFRWEIAVSIQESRGNHGWLGKPPTTSIPSVRLWKGPNVKDRDHLGV